MKEAKIMSKNPIATILMEDGNSIKIELYPDIAKNTVNNFISLINNHFYDGLIFHRVIKDFMIQGGCPAGTGMGDAGYNIRGEFTSNGFKNSLKHERGVISMARTSRPNTASSQFFIMHKDSPFLDGQYASFGKAIEGMEEVDKIANVKVDRQDRPVNDQRISSITVELFDYECEEPEKL
jgi:peptidyl-prolyl cis-trans isomerase B (cyclophilin B)